MTFHADDEVLRWHKEYEDYTVPVVKICNKYGVKHETLLGNFRRLGLPLRPSGFRTGNCKGRNGEDSLRLKYLWLFNHTYKRRARIKGHPVTITEDEFIQLVTSNCHYCGKSWELESRTVAKRKVHMVTIDRKDPTLGYVLDNCVPCCKRCNTIKMDMQYSEWLDHLRTILAHQDKKL